MPKRQKPTATAKDEGRSKASRPAVTVGAEKLPTELFQDTDSKEPERFDSDDKSDWSFSLKGVIKVFCTTTKPNYRMPWQMEAQRSYTGSGCLLPGRRIITNAHVVNFGTTITLLKHGNPKRFLARVVSFGHEYDLALLEISDSNDVDEFWQDTVPFSLGELPPLNSTVLILGYPTDIDSVSVTEGVVSRVMMDGYRHSNEELLKLQVDAAINPGNSGGPAIVSGKLIGVVSEVQKLSQNIGYAIPASVIVHFLTQVTRAGVKSPDQQYPGICVLGLSWTTCDNASLCDFHRLTKAEHGVVISNVLPLSVCQGKLARDDVLMAVDGLPVADDGTIELRKSGERVKLTYAVARKFAGDNCTLTVKRDGQVRTETVKLGGVSPRFTVSRQLDQPQYFVWSGLVFLQCSTEYIEEAFPSEDGGIDFEAMPLNLQVAWYRNEKKHPNQEVVILSQVLADDVCLGYMHYKNRVVERLNGSPVQNLAELAHLLSNLGDDTKQNDKGSDTKSSDTKTKESSSYVRIDLDMACSIVIDTRRAHKAHPTILARNHIHPSSHLSKANSIHNTDPTNAAAPKIGAMSKVGDVALLLSNAVPTQK